MSQAVSPVADDKARHEGSGPGGLPLGIRLILAALLVGAAAWFALDIYQTRHFSEVLTEQFARELDAQAHTDRLRLDEQIRAHMALVRVLAEHRPALNGIQALPPAAEPVMQNELPLWLPRRSVLRSYSPPNTIIVADPRHRVLGIWRNGDSPTVEALKDPPARLFLMAEVEPLLTSFAGIPHVLASTPLKDDGGTIVAWLLAASAIDSDFLQRGQGRYLSPDHIVAVIGSGEPPAILASSDTTVLPPGTPLETAEKSFLIAGKSFFDYGNSELLASFATLIPRREIAYAGEQMLAIEREHRTLIAGTLSTCFLLALAYLSLRLRRLVTAVGHFRAGVLSAETARARPGDELADLERSFERLTAEVIASRTELDRQAQETLALALEQMRTRSEYDRLRTLHAVTDHLGVGVIRTDHYGPVAANETMTRFIVDCAPITAFLEARDRSGDAVFHDRSGRERIFAMLSPAIEPRFVLVRDVTEERRAEQTLKRMNETLEQLVYDRTRALEDEIARHLETEAALMVTKERAEMASRSKSEFLANVSHELRTPLNAIIGFSEVMIGEVFGPLGGDRYTGYARDIHFSGKHLLELINDILDISKIEAGRMELCLEPTSLAEVSDSAVRLVRERFENAGVILVVEIADNVPQVRGDSRRLKQTIVNLLSNSAKFTADGGTVTLCVRPANQAVRVEVSDTGIGMTSDELALALEPFRQVDGGLARRHEGTGLGLPLARSFVEMHGGRFQVESRKGVGTTVWFELPANTGRGGGPKGPPRNQSAFSGAT